MATLAGLIQPDILGAVNAGFDRGQEQRKSRILAQYAQPALSGDQGALSQIYQADPAAGMRLQQQAVVMGQQQKQFADQDLARLGQHARLVTALADAGDMQGASNLYKTIYPEASKILGPNLPPEFDPSMIENMKKIANAIDPQTKKDFINVTPGSTLVDPATGKPVYASPVAPSYTPIQTDQGYATFNSKTGQATPLSYGGSPRAPSDPMAELIAQANKRVQAGESPDVVEADLLKQAGSTPGVQVGGTSGRVMPPAKTVSQNDTYRAATADELKQFGLPPNASAQVNTRTGKLDVISKPPALSPDKLADVAAKRQKVEQAKQDTVSTFDDSINKIDQLLKSGGFAELGTFFGDAKTHIPHTDAADAKAQLDTIGNQSVINTLSSLKSLSATGASGFGALSEKEGDILRNAAANLSTAQSNAALAKNLKELREKLVRSRDRVKQQQVALPEDSASGASSTAPGGWSVEIAD